MEDKERLRRLDIVIEELERVTIRFKDKRAKLILKISSQSLKETKV